MGVVVEKEEEAEEDGNVEDKLFSDDIRDILRNSVRDKRLPWNGNIFFFNIFNTWGRMRPLK